jgi:hypothetical protein
MEAMIASHALLTLTPSCLPLASAAFSFFHVHWSI